MPSFHSAFAEAMARLGYGEAPERQLTPAEVSRQAREIAEREGIKYRSARRRLERRRTTGREARGQPNRRFGNAVRRRGLHVHAELELAPSDPVDMRPRTIDVDLSGELVDGIADALERADMRAAESEFRDALLRAYEGVGPDDPSFLSGATIGEVDELEIDWLDE